MFYFVYMDLAIKKYFGLTHPEHAIAWMLFLRMDRQKNSWTEYSYNEIAKEHDISRRTAIRSIKRLIEKGIVEINYTNKDLKRTTLKWWKAHQFNGQQDLENIAKRVGDKVTLVAKKKVVSDSHQSSAKVTPVASDNLTPLHYNNTIKNNYNNLYKENSTQNSIENQLNTGKKNTPQSSAPPPLKKDFGALGRARNSYEKAREQTFIRLGLEPDVISWGEKESYYLEKIVKQFMQKMRANGYDWQKDDEFRQKFFDPFMEMVGQTTIWFNKTIDLADFAGRFQKHYDEINLQKNGSTNRNSKSNENDLITPEVAIAASSNVAQRLRAKRQLYGQ